MNILTQAIELAYTKMKENKLDFDLDKYLNASYWNPSSINYAHLIEKLDKTFHQLARDSLIVLLEQMDHDFRHSSYRCQTYYVKATRPRTIVTIFGPITYRRTEYQHRYTKESYCYVDRKIGLDKRIRYDPTISCLAYEMYANHNSMIKVGKELGDRIYGFSLNKERCREAIPRQTIWRMLNRFKAIYPNLPVEQKTPQKLYVMADEKYIPIQGKDKPAKKMMSKLAVSFEGIEGQKTRHKLANPKYFYYQNGNFWEQLFHHLSKIYDLSLVENIYILGDGATWIKSGTEAYEQVKFGLCKFHFTQAINNITEDKKIKQLIMDYAIHSDYKNLKLLFQSLIQSTPDRTDILKQKMDYILNNLSGIRTMYHKVKIGCPMEQAIQHVLQSPFTSVPKAYSHRCLPTYINARINFMNNYDLRESYLKALDINSNIDYIKLSKDSLDLSILDKNPNLHDYHLHLPYVGAIDKLK